MRNIGTLALGMALAALSLVAFPSLSHAYTQEEQAACQPDAFRLCGSEIPDVDRVTACMVARRAQLSPECRRFFGPDPEPASVTAPRAGRPANIRPKAAKSAKPATTKKPATPKVKKPAKPAAS